MRLTYTRERGAGWARAAMYAGGFVVLLWVIEFVDYCWATVSTRKESGPATTRA